MTTYRIRLHSVLLPLLLKVEVRVISRSRKLRIITLTTALITLDIRKTESDSCFIIHWTKHKMEVVFLPLPWRQATQSTRTWHDYPYKSCTAVIHDMITRDVWVSLLYNLQLDDVKCADLKNFTVCFRPIRKEIVSSMYNNNTYYISELVVALWLVILAGRTLLHGPLIKI